MHTKKKKRVQAPHGYLYNQNPVIAAPCLQRKHLCTQLCFLIGWLGTGQNREPVKVSGGVGETGGETGGYRALWGTGREPEHSQQSLNLRDGWFVRTSAYGVSRWDPIAGGPSGGGRTHLPMPDDLHVSYNNYNSTTMQRKTHDIRHFHLLIAHVWYFSSNKQEAWRTFPLTDRQGCLLQILSRRQSNNKKKSIVKN